MDTTSRKGGFSSRRAAWFPMYAGVNRGIFIQNDGRTSMNLPCARLVAWCLIVAVWGGAVAADDAAIAKTRTQYDELLSSTLAEREAAGDKVGAEWVAAKKIPRGRGRTVVVLPTAWEVTPPKTPAADWAADFVEKTQPLAQQIFEEAQSTVAKNPQAAFALLHEVLAIDPHHAEARRVLGWKKVGNAWRQGAAKATAKTAKEAHPDLGWKAGKYWTVDTDHFSIVTSHSAKAGIDLGNELELVYEAWAQLFFEFWGDGAALQERFAGKDKRLCRDRKYRVVMCKSRDEYQKQLGVQNEVAGRSVGIYLDDKRVSLFFAADDPTVRATWRHEAVHQLFDESRRDERKPIARDGHAWIVEGIAMYFESMRTDGAIGTLGGFDSERLQFARLRALGGDTVMPSAQVVALSREKLQQHPDVAKLYSQIAGLTHFLVDGNNRSHRDGLRAYLRQVYKADAEINVAGTLGISFDEIDAGYRRFLDVNTTTIAECPPATDIKKLCLRRTSIQNADCAAFVDCKQLDWLDLSGTAVTDEGLQSFSQASKLKAIFAESTAVTGEVMAILASMPLLEEVYLSGTKIDDEGLVQLSKLKKLATLEIIQCDGVTDAGLEQLAKCKLLTALDVTQTKVTPEGIAKLKKQLPKLKVTGP